MESTIKKLWNRNFSLIVIGQFMSIFGNQVLNFALPLYILDISGSSALYGLVLGLPFLSLLIMSPIGGIMADRLKKQMILFWLDITTTVIIVLYMIISGMFATIVPIVIVKLLALNAIQGMYMPASESSIPVLVPSDKLITANSVNGIGNALSNLAAPAVAGILLGAFGLFPILMISAVCFAFTAIMDLFIRIPYKKQSTSGSVIQIVKGDISQAYRFVVKEKPILAKYAIILFLFTMTLISMFLVGLPVLITQFLGMSMEYAGISKGIAVFGLLVGSIVTGTLGERITITKGHLPLIVCSMLAIPMGVIFLLDISNFTAYVMITVISAFLMMIWPFFNIPLMAFMQKITPTELVGKVFSFLSVLPFLAMGLGQVIFGVLFEQFSETPWFVIFANVVVATIIALFSHRHFKEARVELVNSMHNQK